MTRLLIDTSVLIKWFHGDGESELEQARALRTAHFTDELDAHMLDLAAYEVGDVLARALRWTATAVAEQLGRPPAAGRSRAVAGTRGHA